MKNTKRNIKTEISQVKIIFVYKVKNWFQDKFNNDLNLLI
jgi:hypothetical protein